MKRTALENWICSAEGLASLTRSGLEALQLERLNGLLAREKRRGGFYSGLPEHLDRLDELSVLPFTTPGDLASSCSSLLLTSTSEVRRIISGATSGTTGPAKRVFYTGRDLEHTVGFFATGISELVSSGDAVLVAMPFSGPDGLGELICRAIARLGARAVPAGVSVPLGALDELLDRERPSAYIGMSVPLLSLLRWRLSCGRRLYIERALVSGDACPEGVCHEIEALLGTRLFPHYGSREMCLGGAVTCQAHEGMHIRENHIIAEIIGPDGRPLPEGETGELVITTLDMQAMPLIRYRTGDLTRFLPGPCPCGGITRRIGPVRRADNPMEELDSVLFRLDGLIDYRAELTGSGLRIDAVGSVSPAELLRVAGEYGCTSASVSAAGPEFAGCCAGKRRITGAAANP